MLNDTRPKAIANDEEDPTAILEHESKVATPEPTATEDHHRPSMARSTKLLISIGVAIVVLVGGYLIRNAFLYEDTDDAQVDGHVMPLSARISGQVQEVRVIEGQLVHAGDVLVLPAGTGHMRLQSTADFKVVGAYPEGMEYNLRTGKQTDRPHVFDEIAQVPIPTTDPVYGDKGPLTEWWN